MSVSESRDFVHEPFCCGRSFRVQASGGRFHTAQDARFQSVKHPAIPNGRYRDPRRAAGYKAEGPLWAVLDAAFITAGSGYASSFAAVVPPGPR